jgi:hypothetical protein
MIIFLLEMSHELEWELIKLIRVIALTLMILMVYLVKKIIN